MADREKLMELLEEADDICDSYVQCKGCPYNGRDCIDALIADHLIANGVRLETKQATSDESKRIEELEAELAEREKVVIQLRKQWQDAEMHICTMCGHFDHKTDGNIVYGNKNCGEIVGYPYCKGKFTPWIPVTERLPKDRKQRVLVKIKDANSIMGSPDIDTDRYVIDEWVRWGDFVTHWMPLPEAPKEHHCICCGAIIPDGQNACPNCLVTVKQTEVE